VPLPAPTVPLSMSRPTNLRL